MAIDACFVLTTGAERRLLSCQDRVIRECEATYDALAADYDHHLQHECRYRSPKRIAAALANLDAKGLWIDLGAGTGLVGEALHHLGTKPEMIAVDVSSAMLDQIVCPLYRQRHQADVLSGLPVRPASCAGAVAAGLMEYILDVSGLMTQVANVLAPGGWFVFTFCPNPETGVKAFDAETDLHCHDARLVEQCLVAAGLQIVATDEFPAYVNGEQGWIRHRMVTARRDERVVEQHEA